ncbi:DUF3732 domain-containing protein [Streptomyces sp. NPDC054834]
MTVLADTDDGIRPLLRIGSGENWVGYHLVAHLALHRFFTLHQRPVPRMLLLDQVTQPFYPSEVARGSGSPDLIRSDADRHTVRGMFELMYRFTSDLAPNFQLIVRRPRQPARPVVPGLRPLQLAQRRRSGEAVSGPCMTSWLAC